jgi:hypothetical protein
VLGQLGDAFLTGDGPADDVAAGLVGQRLEHAIEVEGRLH